MNWSRWNPFNKSWINQMDQLHQEMNRLFDRWTYPVNVAGAVYPAINVWEEGDGLVVEAELPGMDLKDLEIFVTGNNHLTLKGERKFAIPDKGVQHRQEREFGSFVRSLNLPIPVNSEQVEAKLENGVLRIFLPKHEAAKPRRIAVKG